MASSIQRWARRFLDSALVGALSLASVQAVAGQEEILYPRPPIDARGFQFTQFQMWYYQQLYPLPPGPFGPASAAPPLQNIIPAPPPLPLPDGAVDAPMPPPPAPTRRSRLYQFFHR
jgi:hypothetical protein